MLIERLRQAIDGQERAVLFTVVDGNGAGAKRLVFESGEQLGDGVPEAALGQFDELIRGGRNRLLELERRVEGVRGVVRAAAASLRLRGGGYR